MNKIFKKIWNKSRGCFVAVSEVASAASKKGGENVLVIGLLAVIPSFGAAGTLTINSDWNVSQQEGMTINMHHLQDENVIVNGNYYMDSTCAFYLADQSKVGGLPIGNLQVNGSFYLQFPSIDPYPQNPTGYTLAHVHLKDATGTLNIRDNFYISSISYLHTSNFFEDKSGKATSYLKVGGTTTIENGGSINAPGTYGVSSQFAESTHVLNVLDLYGSYHGHGGSINTKYSRTIAVGNLRNGGYFGQGSNTPNGFDNVYFGTLNLFSGSTLGNNGALVIGAMEQNKVAVGNVLNLNGGAIHNRDGLVQHQGTINVNSAYDFSNFVQNGGTLNNNNSLTLTDVTLNGGSLNNNNTLTLRGNVVTNGRLALKGTINNQGSWVENSPIVLQGTFNNSGTFVTAGLWNFQNGSKFNNAGTLQTNNASNVFDSLGSQGQTALTTVSRNAQLPEEAKTALTDLFRHYVPGSVAQNLVDHATFSGGKVIVTGVNLTQTQADDLKKEFKSKFFLLPTEISASTFLQEC